jgi:dihydropteroate synthase
LIIQIINLGYKTIFQRYLRRYNIFRDLYEIDLLGLEIRNLENILCERLRDIVLASKEICYTINKGSTTSDFLVLGSISVFKELSKKIGSSGNEDIGYKISSAINAFANYDDASFTVGEKNYPMNKAYVMGILNVTPNSFSDGGKYFSLDDAFRRTAGLLEAGVDFIDIGGESTRPGADPVPLEEEMQRVVPLIKKISDSFPGAVVSIDTSKSEVAKAALDSGAKIVNDISALTFDKNIKNVVKEFNASLVLMHMKGNPKTMQKKPEYDDVVLEVFDFLKKQILEAESSGIKSIIVDPGIGFGKRVEDNYELIKRLDEFKCLGYPILIGVSRKSFIGNSLNLEVEKREEATLSAETISIFKGAKIIRTHEVKNTIQAVKMANFINSPDKVSVV